MATPSPANVLKVYEVFQASPSALALLTVQQLDVEESLSNVSAKGKVSNGSHCVEKLVVIHALLS